MLRVLLPLVLLGNVALAADPLPSLTEVRIKSSADGSEQPSLYWAPSTAENEPTPILVFLHSWSGNYKQKNDSWLAQAQDRGWIYLHPDFRGRNVRPQACGSKLARQDVLDALAWAKEKWDVDTRRVYLAGGSGGGHMAMLMAGYHPEQFSAVSAWVGITNLADWYHFHAKGEKIGRYAQNVAACCGGIPGQSSAIDAQYRARSPLFHLHQVGNLHLDIAAGVLDGHTGSVPIHHSLNAFNAVAKANGFPTVSDQEIEQLWKNQELNSPSANDTKADESYGRDILLRRFAGNTRVTIFEGGHEGLPNAACHWLEQKVRKTKDVR